MGSIFSFKKFQVNQAGCAMKINTDGVLLGAIVVQEKPQQILDIGTGTGVIAMMLAQRFPQGKVDAVEIDASAASAANANCSAAPFNGRINVYHTSIEQYQTANRYDLIVSNPPFFVNDLKSGDKRKELARHADEDFFILLLRKAADLLRPEGSIWLILPVKQAEKLVVDAVLFRLFPATVIHIYSDESKAEFRHIVCLRFTHATILHQHFYIYEAEGIYTAAYKEMLKDFFLAF